MRTRARRAAAAVGRALLAGHVQMHLRETGPTKLTFPAELQESRSCVLGWRPDLGTHRVATDQSCSFGELLREYRRAAGLSQRLLATRAGLSARGIQDLEQGARLAPYLETARRLADALDLGDDARKALLSTRSSSIRPGRSGTRTVSQRGARGEKRQAHPNAQRLPDPLTSFVGRQREVLELRKLLHTTRLLTLTGAGGVGKTRLAREVAREGGDEYGVRASLVELAHLADPALVSQAVATALNIGEQPGQPLLETLLASLRRRPVLLILDNCEHLIHACAELTESVLRSCPNVLILATSREPLDLGAELTWRVPSLSLPVDQSSPSFENLARSDAVRLFVERAGNARPGFELTPGNAGAIAQVCLRLDGIPLAIELAAARVSALSVEQIASRLDDGLKLLTGGGRTAVDRQRTLRGTLDWSYELLSNPERVLLHRLGVFAGGWTLEAAEAVCADEALNSHDVLDLLTNLVKKSLVVAEDDASVTRYRLLDPLRGYALKKLRINGDEEPTLDRHCEWYIQLAERFETDWRSPRQRNWLHVLEREEANLRIALRGCITRLAITDGLRLAAALHRFWDLRNRLTEGRVWLSELLAMAAGAPDPVVAKATYAAGYLAAYQKDSRAAEPLLIQALDLSRGLGDQDGEVSALIALGVVAHSTNDSARAESFLADGLALARARGNTADTYWALFYVAEQARRNGDLVRAQALHEESLVLKRQQGDEYGIASGLYGLAQVALLRNDHTLALRLVSESLVLHRDLGHWRGIILCLNLLGYLAAARGDAPRSIRLFGAVDAINETIGVRRAVTLHSENPDRTVTTLSAMRERLGVAAFKEAWDAGQAMTIDEAVALALSSTPADPPIAKRGLIDRTIRHAGLTRRETEVLHLIVQGNSNQEIAATLILSTRTVERHIAKLYGKLGAHSRVDATAYALRHGIA